VIAIASAQRRAPCESRGSCCQMVQLKMVQTNSSRFHLHLGDGGQVAIHHASRGDELFSTVLCYRIDGLAVRRGQKVRLSGLSLTPAVLG